MRLLHVLAAVSLLAATALAGCNDDTGGTGGSPTTSSTSAAPSTSSSPPPNVGCPTLAGDLCPQEGLRCLDDALAGGKATCDEEFAQDTCSLPDANENDRCDESRLCLLPENDGVGVCELAPKCGLDATAVRPDDFDGDFLSDKLERALADHDFVAALCDADADDDGIPDGHDLNWRTNATAGVAQDQLANLQRTGIQVDVWLDDFYQYNEGIADGDDCDVKVDFGGYMDDPRGDGDPWLATGSFLGTGNLVAGAAGGKPVAFEGFTHDDHYWDLECKVGMHVPMAGGAAVLPEDVGEWVRNPLPLAANLVFPAAFGAPTIAMLQLFVDDDGDCDHEIYTLEEPDAVSCDGDVVVPDFGVDLLDITLTLASAPGTLTSVQSLANPQGLLERCILHYGIYVCLTMEVTDAQGRGLDWCNVGFASQLWSLPGQVLESPLDDDCLTLP